MARLRGSQSDFKCTLLVPWWKWQLAFLKLYICKRDYGVCVQINEAKTMTHNQDFISQRKATDRLISALLPTHTHTHTYMQRPFGITDICDTLDKILSGTILYSNEPEKAVISPCNLLLICVCINRAWCLSTLIVVIFTLSLSWQAVVLRNSQTDEGG